MSSLIFSSRNNQMCSCLHCHCAHDDGGSFDPWSSLVVQYGFIFLGVQQFCNGTHLQQSSAIYRWACPFNIWGWFCHRDFNTESDGYCYASNNRQWGSQTLVHLEECQLSPKLAGKYCIPLLSRRTVSWPCRTSGLQWNWNQFWLR